MDSIYKRIFYRYAEDDLLEIIDYYYEINPDFSKKLLLIMEETVDELKTFPERGRIVPELETQNINDYRELIENNYRIIYSIQEKTVIVHTIIDSRRNFEELIIKKLVRFYS